MEMDNEMKRLMKMVQVMTTMIRPRTMKMVKMVIRMAREKETMKMVKTVEVMVMDRMAMEKGIAMVIMIVKIKTTVTMKKIKTMVMKTIVKEAVVVGRNIHMEMTVLIILKQTNIMVIQPN